MIPCTIIHFSSLQNKWAGNHVKSTTPRLVLSSSHVQFRGYLIKGCVPKIISLITSRDTNKQRAANMVLKPYQVSSWEDIYMLHEFYCDLNLSYISSPIAQILSPRCLAKLNLFQQSSWSPATCQFVHISIRIGFWSVCIYIYISVDIQSISITGKNSL